MGSFSIWHWLIVILWLVVFVVPLVKILGKAGFSGWWVLLSFIPIVNIIALWIFALADWPALTRKVER